MLNEPYDKQEGVPFNISIGGGTQGLLDTVYSIDSTPYDIYPLGKYFGGTFIGYFKSFKFYDCLLNYQRINNIR